MLYHNRCNISPPSDYNTVTRKDQDCRSDCKKEAQEGSEEVKHGNNDGDEKNDGDENKGGGARTNAHISKLCYYKSMNVNCDYILFHECEL